MAGKKKILVLISGSGTNLQALIDACAAGKIDGEIVKVVSSSPDAYGLTRASNSSIPTHVHDLQGQYYKNIPKEDKKARKQARDKFNLDLAEYIVRPENKPDLIVCAGWMLILSRDFLLELEKHKVPIINLHPALPGAFAGINAIERAWQAGQNGEISTAGVMIHKVITEVDEGEPLVVKEFPLIRTESLEQYTDRVHSVEHIAIVEGTQKALQTLVL
ncbi:phosphoribosylglycinamide formyltransferase [Sugiyamaella lignohabitans]|uniref:Phosphoribosylglycinamide formyltransferase n=1 Tax=Sugiyamaella lignohabitans TaxID=796027 RepID=A0A167D360_9ASCO|nr:phosphoribosylglycinamide formyltransferase [Sugiyamaella lignohabitans]ANB12422.1 phosphoribosylglycinamide formyltransferase [Sugiyamaella lignohabitans]